MTAATHRFSRTAIAIALLAFLVACATLQTPPPGLPLQDQDLLRVSRDAINIGIRPIVAEDDYLQLFDDYLPQVGIVAIWVEIGNERATTIALDPAKWYVRTGIRDFRSLGIANVFKRYYDGHHVRMYSQQADAAARRSLEQAVLKRGNIEPAQKRAGFVFFGIDPGTASEWSRNARLIASGLSLDRRSRIAIEIALSHADP